MSDKRPRDFAKATDPRSTGVGPSGRSPAVAIVAKRPPARPTGSKGPRRRKPQSRWVARLSSLFTAVMAVAVLVGGLGVFVYTQFESGGPLQVARGFVVPKGEGRLDIAARLERDGIITNRWIFSAGQMLSAAMGSRKSADMKAGTYEFKKSVSMHDVVDILTEGRTAAAKITIPEGLTSQQIVERLRANDALSGEIDTVPPEGSLLPDTYVFARGATRLDLIERMQAEQLKVASAAWEKRAPNVPFQTLQQALIMASIIEKETGKSDEREKVAAVFVNRLRRNMRLQSDPTIIYGVVGGQGPLGRPISRSDIDQKTAYNTYQIDGLPPTPISNPGRLAIEATLNPAQTNDVYFVADGSGGHAFSETLKEHNAAVSNWRRIERDAKAAKAVQQAAAAPTAPVATAPAGVMQPLKINGAKPSPTATKAVEALISRPDEGGAESAASLAPAATDADAIPLPVRKPKR